VQARYGKARAAAIEALPGLVAPVGTLLVIARATDEEDPVRDPAMMPLARVLLSGGSYLRLATGLLQQMRLATPAGGLWEAADVQWWWRQERPTDSCGQLFWLDEQGEPVAAVIVTDFFHSVRCDVLVLPEDSWFGPTAWQEANDTRALRVLWTATTCPEKGSAQVIEQLSLRVRIGWLTRTEVVQLNQGWALSGPSRGHCV
jgi:hypothetical protein